MLDAMETVSTVAYVAVFFYSYDQGENYEKNFNKRKRKHWTSRQNM